MPKYFFDTGHGTDSHRDQDGLDLADQQSAIGMAWTCLQEELSAVGRPPEARVFVVVSDENRNPIYEVAAGGSVPQN